MARTPQNIPPKELEVLQILWQFGPCSVRQIVDHLRDAGSVIHAATAQKLLERLEEKQWVARDRSESVQKFFACGDRDDLIGQRLEGIADQLCEGSMTPLISHLVKKEKLSPKDIRTLRDLIEELDPNSKKNSSK
jgi:BlaI family transcriptional regulator, penicillinase repressor